ncbi:MAG: hypothetical protein COV07_00675 [Candidatus Vogelbacteria bacterium CG10_big_fil_rev_8_21_14_0_10_45_14]|uniref:Fibronectin type-III domain-containing protein n=1 Tax=Candidatus Vogelbacteria bacterium CG10_big_fil_rev_8_21_14_0_10_45_14 TaxID=1975042 RepID=A0A2H0RKZ3_9BACT|nr:MAG: hypothetical protein COV07_00675 [Candidatus Vogelbacteria bacterium CG10_big_fil_rev_8_21_14_0_10_45_14]
MRLVLTKKDIIFYSFVALVIVVGVLYNIKSFANHLLTKTEVASAQAPSYYEGRGIGGCPWGFVSYNDSGNTSYNCYNQSSWRVVTFIPRGAWGTGLLSMNSTNPPVANKWGTNTAWRMCKPGTSDESKCSSLWAPFELLASGVPYDPQYPMLFNLALSWNWGGLIQTSLPLNKIRFDVEALSVASGSSACSSQAWTNPAELSMRIYEVTDYVRQNAILYTYSANTWFCMRTRILFLGYMYNYANTAAALVTDFYSPWAYSTPVKTASDPSSGSSPSLPAPEATASAIDSSTIDVDWNDVTGAVKYKIDAWRLEEGFQVRVSVPDSETAYYRHQGLHAGTKYYYKVAGVRADGQVGEYSSEVSATTHVAPPTFIDIGLRIRDKGQTVKIAIHPEGDMTSPLRIYKGGKIWSIALVDPILDPTLATGLRIRTNGTIKALRKLP